MGKTNIMGNKTVRIIRFGLLLLGIMIYVSCKDKNEQQIPTGKAVKGTFYVDMYESGIIEAVKSINILSPTISWRYGGNMKITNIVKDGTEVQAGDVVLSFDPSDVNRGIVEAQGRMEISTAERERMLAQQQSDLEELQADYEVTRISQEISKIRFEQATYESDIMKKEIQLNLEKADISLARAKEQIENRKKINVEELKQMELSIEQDKARLKEAFDALDRMTVVTPSPGIAIIARNYSTNDKYQVGDQVWSGQPLISLPDLSKLKATVKINEVDIGKISKDLKVEIKPDAFSETTFTGIVSTVANLAVNKEAGSKIKVFPVEILINETHKNLLPGLTVSCRIIIDEIKDVLYVPIVSVFAEGDKRFVYKKTIGGFEKVEVETGASNSDFTVITEGLDEDDVVALVNPDVVKEEETNTEQ